MEDKVGFRDLKKYVKKDYPRELAILDLHDHLLELNDTYELNLRLALPPRAKRHSAVIGKESDDCHLLYQDLMDAILAECPRPITMESIKQVLLAHGEKPSCVNREATNYYREILKVLNPETKLHRGAEETLKKWGIL